MQQVILGERILKGPFSRDKERSRGSGRVRR